MKKIKDLDYDNVPGVRQSAKIFLKAIIRKIYIVPAKKIQSARVKRRFQKTKRMIGRYLVRQHTNIPKIIHYIWVGGNKKPAAVA